MTKYRIGLVSFSDELYHHGIKGQKWGVRRYQNPDGTLTDEGRKRYYKVLRIDKGRKVNSTSADLRAVNVNLYRNLPAKTKKELMRNSRKVWRTNWGPQGSAYDKAIKTEYEYALKVAKDILKDHSDDKYMAVADWLKGPMELDVADLIVRDLTVNAASDWVRTSNKKRKDKRKGNNR